MEKVRNNRKNRRAHQYWRHGCETSLPLNHEGNCIVELRTEKEARQFAEISKKSMIDFLNLLLDADYGNKPHKTVYPIGG